MRPFHTLLKFLTQSHIRQLTRLPDTIQPVLMPPINPTAMAMHRPLHTVTHTTSLKLLTMVAMGNSTTAVLA